MHNHTTRSSSSRSPAGEDVPAGTVAVVRSPEALRWSTEQNALHTLIHQRQLTPSCGGPAPTAERTLDPARMISRELEPRPLDPGPGIRERPRLSSSVRPYSAGPLTLEKRPCSNHRRPVSRSNCRTRPLCVCASPATHRCAVTHMWRTGSVATAQDRVSGTMQIAARHPCAGDALGLNIGDGGRRRFYVAFHVAWSRRAYLELAGNQLQLLRHDATWIRLSFLSLDSKKGFKLKVVGEVGLEPTKA